MVVTIVLIHHNKGVEGPSRETRDGTARVFHPSEAPRRVPEKDQDRSVTGEALAVRLVGAIDGGHHVTLVLRLLAQRGEPAPWRGESRRRERPAAGRPAHRAARHRTAARAGPSGGRHPGCGRRVPARTDPPGPDRRTPGGSPGAPITRNRRFRRSPIAGRVGRLPPQADDHPPHSHRPPASGDKTARSCSRMAVSTSRWQAPARRSTTWSARPREPHGSVPDLRRRPHSSIRWGVVMSWRA